MSWWHVSSINRKIYSCTTFLVHRTSLLDLKKIFCGPLKSGKFLENSWFSGSFDGFWWISSPNYLKISYFPKTFQTSVGHRNFFSGQATMFCVLKILYKSRCFDWYYSHVTTTSESVFISVQSKKRRKLAFYSKI